MDAEAELLRIVEAMIRLRRSPLSYLQYGARGDAAWPFNTKRPRETTRGFLHQTRQWHELQARLGRRPRYAEVSRAIEAVLTALTLEDA